MQVSFDQVDRCPSCGHDVDALTAVAGFQGPGPGDTAICVYCCNLNIIGKDGKQRLPTADESMRLAFDADLIILLDALRRAKSATVN